MLDGALGLIILTAALTGAAKGVGDSILRLIGFAGGLAVSVMYSGRAAEFLMGTRLSSLLYLHIYSALSPYGEVPGGSQEVTAEETINGMLGVETDPGLFNSFLPKPFGGVASDLADKTADIAAERLTELAVTVIAFVLGIIAFRIVFALIRALFRHGRKNSIVIGFLDRVLGFVLGVIRGLLLSCVAAAALMPVLAVFAPLRVGEVMAAMEQTYFAGIIYDINPLLVIFNYFVS